ncbi:MAG: fatty acid desaturase [Pseudanabaena frigida]|uniref:Fatty acid desaturase n=1 Tax=Pseudanabaena frigida TaxID=945775 RepID=A0A2W4WBD8_9CYAN|nr:MAG: fatty acid desaturase [Pseudanabaena frigida]
MNIVDQKVLMTQADYAKKLRPLLPSEAFLPDPNKVWILLINLMILIVGWAIASYLDRWSWYYLWLYLPIAIVMANSIIVLLFSTHDLLHSSAISNPLLRRVVSLFGFAMLWMPPTLWKAVHNREHHNKTNSEQDPDRNYLSSQPKNWGKWIQNAFVPSSEVNPITLVIGLGHAWGMHTFRNLTSVLFFNNQSAKYPVVAFSISEKERQAIALELLSIIGLHLVILTSLEFSPVKILLSYFIPIWIGYAGLIFYIYTNHLLCPMTDVNDVLVNSLSIRVPKIFDLLHINFSYHTEHHIFPGMNPDYYPMVQELLLTHYPEKFNLMDADKVWNLMMKTPRHYFDENTLTDWSGTKFVPCPELNNK